MKYSFASRLFERYRKNLKPIIMLKKIEAISISIDSKYIHFDYHFLLQKRTELVIDSDYINYPKMWYFNTKMCDILMPKGVVFRTIICCSVAQLCLTLCDFTDCSTPGFPVFHQLLELTQTHVHRIGHAIQSSHPLSFSSPAFNLSQHQGLSQ